MIETLSSECRTVRRRLAEGGRVANEHGHLSGCPACSRFAESLALAREELARPRSAAEPDGGFAARVAAAVGGRRHDPGATLGWAALRLLPAAAALVAALGWLAFEAPAAPPDAAGFLLGDPSRETLLSWALLDAERTGGVVP